MTPGSAPTKSAGAQELRPATAELEALCRRHSVKRLDLFGSAATGGFDLARSDLDFLVEFEDLAPAAYAKAYFGLQEGLMALFGRSVDLVTEPALKNPYLRRKIYAERSNLYLA